MQKKKFLSYLKHVLGGSDFQIWNKKRIHTYFVWKNKKISFKYVFISKRYAKIFTFRFLSAYISIIFTRNYSLSLKHFFIFFCVIFSIACTRKDFCLFLRICLAKIFYLPLSQLFFFLLLFDNSWDVVMPQFRYFCGIEIKTSSEDLIFLLIRIRNLNLHNRNITVRFLLVLHFACYFG